MPSSAVRHSTRDSSPTIRLNPDLQTNPIFLPIDRDCPWRDGMVNRRMAVD
jgi:hypothetical protein